MNTKQISTFNFNSSDIRVVTIDGNPWFVAKDVCEILGLGNTGQAYSRLSSCEKTNISRSDVGMGSGRAVVLLAESGLYKLVLRSDKPQARKFQDWVTKVVLPAIRKDGAYVMGEEKVATGEMTEDELIFKAMNILTKKVDRLTAERDLALSEVKSLTKQLNQMDTGVYFREILKRYPLHGESVQLGRMASHICSVDRIEITYETRTLHTGRSVQAKIYPREVLDRAAKRLSLI